MRERFRQSGLQTENNKVYSLFVIFKKHNYPPVTKLNANAIYVDRVIYVEPVARMERNRGSGL
jgi:hypothetical protein